MSPYMADYRVPALMGEGRDGLGVFQVFPETSHPSSTHSRCTLLEPGSLLVGGEKSQLVSRQEQTGVTVRKRVMGEKRKEKPKTRNSNLAELLGWLLWWRPQLHNLFSWTCCLQFAAFLLSERERGENSPPSCMSPCSSHVLRNCPRFLVFEPTSIPRMLKTFQDLAFMRKIGHRLSFLSGLGG